MDLILWRHADAADAADGAEDTERALTARGERQAARMAHWLNQHLPATTRILVSPARRTQQTAAALERKFKTLEAVGLAASVPGLLAAFSVYPRFRLHSADALKFDFAALVTDARPLRVVPGQSLPGPERQEMLKKCSSWVSSTPRMMLSVSNVTQNLSPVPSISHNWNGSAIAMWVPR